MEQIRLGIIGCGAITEKLYFPILVTSPLFKIKALVDKNIDRAKSLAAGGDVSIITNDYREIIGQVDAVVLAVPNYLHEPISKELLVRNVHVLVEKPMAMTTKECDEMIKLAQDNRCVLAVGHSKRYFRSHRFVKILIEEGFLGKIQSFDFKEGTVFNWPAATDFLFRKETGGGVLADIGPHTLDLLLWWLGDVEEVQYYDDNMGGVEADCELHLKLKSGCTGIVELSRTRHLRNTYLIVGEKATIEVGADWTNPPIIFKLNNDQAHLEGKVMMTKCPQKEYTYEEVMQQQLEEFAMSIQQNRKPYVDGKEGRKSIELIEACYHNKKLLNQPWVNSDITEINYV